MLFKQSQRHNLEGNFNDYFDTYFNEEYRIDDLSFISPEVMQAIIEAGQYDVEIYKDKLYLYNELENMPQQLLDIEQKGNNIRQKLLNNIITYRDERVEYGDGRKTVSLLGLHLSRSMMRQRILQVLGLLMLISGVCYLIYELATTSSFTYTGLYFIGWSLLIIVPSTRKINDNKRMEKFYSDLSEVGVKHGMNI